MVYFVAMMGLIAIPFWANRYQSLLQLKSRVHESWLVMSHLFQTRSRVIAQLAQVSRVLMLEEIEFIDSLLKDNQAAEKALDRIQKVRMEVLLDQKMKDFFSLANVYPKVLKHPDFYSQKVIYFELAERIEASRSSYNLLAARLNRRIRNFPGNLMAWSFRIGNYPIYLSSSAN